MSNFLIILVRVLLFAAIPGLTFAMYKILSAPLRQRERTQLFLDLLEAGLREGRGAEQTIVGVARSGDRVLGRKFKRLAEHLENGVSFGEALARVPLLPAQVTATLRVGEQTGDIRRVLPACRMCLDDVQSRATVAVNYLIVLALVLNPNFPGVFPFLMIFIVPKFAEISHDLLGKDLPPVTRFMIASFRGIFAIQWFIIVILLVAVIAYENPPWLRRFGLLVKRPADALAWWLPWKRKRLLRSFSSMLATLLDAGVPENRAVELAAESTANGVLLSQAGAVSYRLRQGVALTQAVAAIDATGEFRWRLSNAVHNHGGFLRALAGWHEALDAKAYQAEQTASQLVTTALVILNGVFVALVAIGMFQVFTTLIMEMSMW
jgi:type II secretory pathway component PulF